MLQQKLGRRIAVLRRTRNLTQAQLAKLVGCSVDFVSLVERGVSAPTVARLEKYAKVLKVVVRDLFTFDQRKRRSSTTGENRTIGNWMERSRTTRTFGEVFEACAVTGRKDADMKKKPKAIIDELVVDEDEAFFWDSFWPGETGLKQKVWFCGPTERKDGRPRGRVRVGRLFCPFSIDEPAQWMVKPAPGVSAKDFAEIARYVRLNREAIMA